MALRLELLHLNTSPAQAQTQTQTHIDPDRAKAISQAPLVFSMQHPYSRILPCLCACLHNLNGFLEGATYLCAQLSPSLCRSRSALSVAPCSVILFTITAN